MQIHGFGINADDIQERISRDREATRNLNDEDLEAVAGNLIGTRFSGGHKSGPSC